MKTQESPGGQQRRDAVSTTGAAGHTEQAAGSEVGASAVPKEAGASERPDGQETLSAAEFEARLDTTGPLSLGSVPGVPRRQTIWLPGIPRFSLDDRLGRVLLSIVLAILLWVYVVNLENPAQTTLFRGLSIEVRGTGPNLKVLNQDEIPTVNTTVQAPQSVMATLSQSDVRPFVDLASLNSGVHEVPVQVDILGAPAEAVNWSVVPRTVQVQLQVQVTRTYSVSVLVRGAPAIGNKAEPPQVNPTQVQVTGSEETVQRIDRVIVPIDISGEASTQQGFIAPVAQDATGQEIRGLNFEPATVEVVVPINLLFNYRKVSVRPQVVGQPAPGYRPSLITADPNNVTVCCDPAVLDPLQFLDTEPVVISGTTSTIITNTRLVLPPGVSLPGQSTVVTVTVSVEALVTQLTLSVAPTIQGVPPNTSAVASPDQIEITLEGTFAQLQNLKPTDIRAIIDVGGRGPGTYEIQPQIFLPQGLQMVSRSPQNVSVTVIAPTAVPPTPTTTAQPTTIPTATVPGAVVSPPPATSTSAPSTPTPQPQSTPTPTSLPAPTASATPGSLTVQEVSTPQPLSTPTATP